MQDNHGRWLGGICRSVGSSGILWAEVMAIRNGLCLVWNLGFRRVVFEYDSSEVLHLVNEMQGVFITSKPYA